MKLLLTGAWADARAHFKTLESKGHELAFLQQERDPLPCDPAWVEGVVCNALFLHHSLDDFPRLRFIQLTSAGLDRVPLDRIRARGIHLCSARGVYSVPMAEFALAGVLGLCKQSRAFTDAQRERRWEKRRDLAELNGKTVTVLGCGSVGTECARRFAAFGCRVRGVDLYPAPNDAYEAVLPLGRLEELLSGTEVLVLTLPLTPETRHLIDAARLSLLPAGAILVNISRGAVVDEAALTDALTNGRLGGAVLDVFETEPLPADSPLWAMENVILTPHNSFVGGGNGARLAKLILENLEAAALEAQP
ncbi:MAG: D-2-hydroxyacid dehydrogenase [Oscillospiraceae bacterium]|nr:D-2-hydroxyacid dehydrogenase [Oscillospiraceae bacterium]